MSLSSELVSQFVKITNDNPKTKNETTVYGTTVSYNGQIYVRLDGSELLTPISTTAATKPGERVTVLIKNHSATITGNISSPAARSGDVDDVKKTVDEMDLDAISTKISEFETVIADLVDTESLNAVNARIDELRSENVTIKESLNASSAEIDELKAEDVEINGKLDASDAEIENLKTTKLDVEIANSKFAKTENLDATNAEIHNLEATYGKFVSTTTEKLSSNEASIKELETKKLNAESAAVTYANIDFSNISKATMAWFYANSGLIENVVVGDGAITGNLVGVTIKGDLIEGNTIKADKLVIKGTDGLYYKLNTNGVTTEAEQTDQNSLNGSIIMAKSITATKINVDDLVAFDATIGGFNITDSSIYSGVKETVGNTTRGIYLDSDGQMAVGDANNFIKYYADAEGNYKLDISAASITFGANKKSVETAIEEVQTSVDNIEIGGRNLLANSAFSDLEDQVYDSYSVMYSPDERMITFTVTSLNTPYVPACYTKLTDYGREHVKGSKLTLSGEYRILTALEFGATNPWVGYQVSIGRDETTGGSSQWLSWRGGTSVGNEVTNGWIKYSKTFDISDYDAVSAGVSILFRDVVGSVQFRNLKVEFGNKSTDWTPTPEDIDKSISEAKNVDIGGRNYIVTSKLSSYAIYNSAPTEENGIISTTYNSSYAPDGQSYLTLKVEGYQPPNEIMTLSGYIKVNGEIPTSNFFTTRASTYGTESIFKDYDSTTGYFVFTQPYSGSNDWIIHAQTTRESGSSDVVTFEKLKFEKGNKPTDWSPAPEDMATAVEVEDVASTANDAQKRVGDAEALIEILTESISMLVTDGSGASLMQQTENGWTFSTGDIQDLVNSTSESLSGLTNEVGEVNGTVDILKQAVSDLGTIAEYVRIGTYEDEPCIELGEGDSDFKLIITNTRIMFMEGTGMPAYINNQSLNIRKAVIEEELQQGNFVWKKRSNGNLGLTWKGGAS